MTPIKTTIGQIMSKDVIWVDPQESLQEAFQLIKNFEIRHLPVVDPESKHVVGLLSEGDIILHCQMGEKGLEINENMKVADAMTKQIAYCYPSSNVVNVAATLITARFNSIPVLDEKNHELLGIVTTTDFLDQICLAQEMSGVQVSPIDHPGDQKRRKELNFKKSG